MRNDPWMHRLLLAVLCVGGLPSIVAGCATVPRRDDGAGEVSRQAAASDDEPAAAQRRDEPEERPEPPPEPPDEDEGVATDVDSRERRVKELAADGGGVPPSELGYFMDVHEASLRQATSGTDISMGRDGSRFQLTVTGSACFEAGSAELKASLRPALQSLGDVLAEFDKTLVTVVSRAEGQEVSRQRAMAVARYLQGRGVADGRIVAIGRATDGGEARVEIVVEPVVD